MNQPNNRRSSPGGMEAEAQLLWALIVLVVMVVGGVYAAMHLGHALADTGVAVQASPFDALFVLLHGPLPWPGMAGVVVLAVIGLLLVLLVVAGFLLKRRLMPKRSRVDASAAYLGRGKDVAEISAKTAREKAQRMGVESAPGVPIGRKVSGGDWLYGSWEDTHLDIWGPRTGKTTSRAIPAVVSAPGAVVATSNKRDLVDATRDVRAQHGPVCVFDPQGIATEDPSWWWNPLSYVTDDDQAAKLAQHLATGSRDPGAKTDA